MKKIIFTVLSVLIVCVFFACQKKEPQGQVQQKMPKLKKEAVLVTETLTDSASKKVGPIECTSVITVDYPTKGNKYLLNSIREWIIDWTYANDSIALDDPAAILKDYNKNSMKELIPMAEEVISERDTNEDERQMGYAQEMTIKKIYENDILVTFMVTTYGYWGGAHGGASAWGTTFRKSDGKVLDHIFRNDKQTEIQEMITKDLQKYFEVNSWEELKEHLFVDEYATSVPMPQGDPYIENDSIVFCYQQYEIGAYAIGMPASKLAIKDLKKMLAPSFLKLLNSHSTK